MKFLVLNSKSKLLLLDIPVWLRRENATKRGKEGGTGMTSMASGVRKEKKNFRMLSDEAQSPWVGSVTALTVTEGSGWIGSFLSG
jgi:hypothetical protein